MIDNLFDVTTENVHLVHVDAFEAATPIVTPPIRLATDKQLSFLKSLFAERQNNEEARILRSHLLDEYKNGRLSTKMASQAIEDIMAMPRDIKPVSAPVPFVPGNIEHGQVWVTVGGAYVRIKKSNTSGRLYGLVWNERAEEWDYELGRETNCLQHLDHRITAEEASAWGHEHQWCVFCSRPLSDPRSEFAGYGEKCASNNHLPWGDVA